MLPSNPFVIFQDLGGYPDCNKVAEMNENNSVLIINPGSKIFLQNIFIIFNFRKLVHEIPEQQLLLRSKQFQHSPEDYQPDFLPYGGSSHHTFHCFCSFQGGSTLYKGWIFYWFDPRVCTALGIADGLPKNGCYDYSFPI